MRSRGNKTAPRRRSRRGAGGDGKSPAACPRSGLGAVTCHGVADKKCVGRQPVKTTGEARRPLSRRSRGGRAGELGPQPGTDGRATGPARSTAQAVAAQRAASRPPQSNKKWRWVLGANEVRTQRHGRAATPSRPPEPTQREREAVQRRSTAAPTNGRAGAQTPAEGLSTPEGATRGRKETRGATETARTESRRRTDRAGEPGAEVTKPGEP